MRYYPTNYYGGHHGHMGNYLVGTIVSREEC